MADLAAARGHGRLGGQPRNLDDKKKPNPLTLHAEPLNSGKDICRTLGTSKAMLFRPLP
jgi:hypothetical protein